MNRLYLHILLIAGVLLMATQPQARSDFSSAAYGNAAAAYLRLPAHAYAAAVGSAVTAWQHDGAGIQYNPALLDAVDGYLLVATNVFLTDDRFYRSADVVIPVGRYIITDLSLIMAGVDKIERRDEYGIQDSENPEFADRENAVALAVAGRLLFNVAVSARARFLYQSLDNTLAKGMGYDLGATWMPDSMICIGVSGLNLASWLWWDGRERNTVPAQARLGATVRLFQKKLTIAVDAAKRLEEPVDVSGGVQYSILKTILLRGGVATSIVPSPFNWRDPDVSLGLGIRYSYFGADYAIVIPVSGIDLISHRISVVLQFRR